MSYELPEETHFSCKASVRWWDSRSQGPRGVETSRIQVETVLSDGEGPYQQNKRKTVGGGGRFRGRDGIDYNNH